MTARNAKAPPGTALHETPVTALRGVGPKVAAHLAALGIESVQDLLLHLPLRYQDRTRIVPIGELTAGVEAVVLATVTAAQLQYGRRRSLSCRLDDGTGTLSVRLFHFGKRQRSALGAGALVHAYGEVRAGARGLEMVHPEYRVVDGADDVRLEDSLTPVYPATEGLGQGTLRALTARALEMLGQAGDAVELLPPEVREAHRLPALGDSVRELHRPRVGTTLRSLLDGAHAHRDRLAFEELLAWRLRLRMLRRRVDRHRAPDLTGAGALARRFLDTLPFDPTAAQRRVMAEIGGDLGAERPMQRLVQGDVGSGKTVVAAAAIVQAIEAGWQAALMAPTELLAEQHLESFRRWLVPLGIEPRWLGGKPPARERRAALDAIASGETPLVVGTHALFQEAVEFARLGLAVIDEQHRFGVHQRLSLLAKGETGGLVPHQLVMTATPIPRTLAMTAYADLDTSIIDELPPGRVPVETAVVPGTRRDAVIESVRAACTSGQQVYWVCTAIDPSELADLRTATDTASALGDALPELRVALVHGRMRSHEKDAVMSRFRSGAVDVLVATTVIEVGVDVPNASVMVIENADRLGLAQLHQLRGRVGRGARESACVMLYEGRLGAPAHARLDVLRETTDGFRIAERDLELRGPGELLGTRQAGEQLLRIARLERDHRWLPAVEHACELLLDRFPAQARALVARWRGGEARYAEV